MAIKIDISKFQEIYKDEANKYRKGVKTWFADKNKIKRKRNAKFLKNLTVETTFNENEFEFTISAVRVVGKLLDVAENFAKRKGIQNPERSRYALANYFRKEGVVDVIEQQTKQSRKLYRSLEKQRGELMQEAISKALDEAVKNKNFKLKL